MARTVSPLRTASPLHCEDGAMSDPKPTPSFPPRGFTRFWWGEAVSSFGTYVTLLALQTVVVLTLDGTAQDVGWLNSARWLPYLVLGLVVGALIDRSRRQPVMVTTDIARAALLISIPVAWAVGILSLPLLFLVMACYGTASLINDAASMSFLPGSCHVSISNAPTRVSTAPTPSRRPLARLWLVCW